MTDHFARLGEPRRPWLDDEALKARFHALTAEHHPDVAAADSPDFAALNVAYQTLREPHARLRHLLELDAPEWTALHRHSHPPAPQVIGALFGEMGDKKQSVDSFLKKRAGADSALARAMLMGDQLMLQDELQEWLAVLEAEKARWLARLPALDAAWQADPAATVPQIAETAQALGYLEKWTAQIREAAVKLQLG